MAKKRKLPDGSVKPPSRMSPEPGKNLLNEHLVKLYDKKEKLSNNQDESHAENKSTENDTDTFKTPSKSSKRRKTVALTTKYPTVRLNSVGGMDKVVKTIYHLLRHFVMPEIWTERHITPVTGILLCGPPGCGKTYLTHAIAGEVGVPLIEVSAPELVSSMSGESESKIREVFAAALATGQCILFIDEIDAICRKRETHDNLMLSRMVNQLNLSFNELSQKDPGGRVLVIGATNTPDFLDIALRRGSRFSHEITISQPDEDGRIDILKIICQEGFSPDLDFRWLARHTPGYVGVDLKQLAIMAQMKAFNREYQFKEDSLEKSYMKHLPEDESETGRERILKHFAVHESEDRSCTLNDFKEALIEFIPCSKREGFVFVPETTWDEIGSYEDIKEELRETIVWPVEYQKVYEENKFLSSQGILLYGPKGCGKTLLAKAMANECSINFLPVKGPELLNMYVGESERAVRKCFERAQNSAPCIIFFDEFDALCPPRSSSSENVAIERVVNQLLTEASGISGRKQVFLIAATNRLDKIDSAMLRPGRLDKVLYVGLPSPAGRVEILRSHLKDKTIEEGLDLEEIAFDPRCEHFSGADLYLLASETFRKALKEKKTSGEKLEGKLLLSKRHFEFAFTKVKPSISEQERRYYEKLKMK